MRARNGNSQRGFTLIEVMISILLTVVAVIGIMGLYRVQARSTGFSRHNTEATVLAQDKFEQVRALQSGATGMCVTPCVEANLNERGGSPGIYTRTTTINQISGLIVGTVQVDVQWDEEGNTERVTARSQW